ncbi:hypothetical protein [Arthrobacter sp. H5]|uniref:hypothetical protein n=1 Tax=Arthrobacter sp. H5 TaxID=1267973 RepID=UPI00047F80D1|nr:hypothetical protein [Arthrobacter sp. H5]
MAKHRADGEPDNKPGETGLDKAADNWAENMADQVPDGVGNNPRDTAGDSPDPRTKTHSSLSEGSNANDGGDNPGR